MKRRPRPLRPEERDLWKMVAATARAMHPDRPDLPEKQVPAQNPKKSPPLLAAFSLGEKARVQSGSRDLAPTPQEHLAGQPLRMDRKTFDRLARGRIEPQARIDLHGMTLSEAHNDLIHFVLGAQAAGLRLVLVITGKGKRGEDHGPIPTRIGALRHQVPHWLALPPIGSAILQVTSANARHGGAGAYYVYLRRRR